MKAANACMPSRKIHSVLLFESALLARNVLEIILDGPGPQTCPIPKSYISIWSMSIEIHGKFLLGRLLLSNSNKGPVTLRKGNGIGCWDSLELNIFCAHLFNSALI